MLFSQKEKLEKLINLSPILSEKEKGEWLALLGLMSERQVQDLETILSSAKPKITNLQSSPPPQLGHIMNLPKVAQEPLKTLGKENFNGLKNNLLHIDPKPEFEKKLKSILSEKELTASSPKYELKPLDGKGFGTPVSKPQPLKPENLGYKPLPSLKVVYPLPKVPEPPSEALQTKVSLAPVLQNLPVQQTKPIADHPLKESTSPIAENFKQHAFSSKPLREGSALDNFVKTNQREKQPEPENKFSAGLSFGKVSEATKAQTINAIKEEIEKNKNLLKPSFQVSAVKKTSANLESLNDLNNLTVDILRDTDFPAFIESLKKLIIRHGYYQVLFNIEKSPVYKSYIQTGIDLLNNQGNFDKPDPTGRSLSREDFEKIADLLREIQG